MSSSSEKARVRGSKSRPDEAIESATRDKPYYIRDESSELLRGRGTIDNVDVSLVCCDILDKPDVIAIQILRQRVLIFFPPRHFFYNFHSIQGINK